MTVGWLATHPDVALALLVGGCFAIYFELLRPGLVIPGAAGAVAALVGLAALLRNPQPSATALVVAIAIWAPVTVFLVRVAARARGNKMGQ